ncbi:MAG: hypothetical protein JOZ18_20265 [Chloroflexi bacterium]|nr:hypothetical protein [Chloroflexota bacterium]
MQDSELDTSAPSKVLRDLLDTIEILRIKRQQEIKEHPHPHLKRFTQQELTDEVCPTYKNLLVGRSLRLPNRESILNIAQYLECTALERNDLLLAARYLPETLELEGPQLKQALEQAHHLMGMLPYPAMIITHTLEVYAANEAFQRLFELPLLSAIAPPHRNLFHFLFHPDLPVRGRSTFNDQAVKVWQAQAARGIHLFKHSNVLYQFEPWYHELIERFSALPDFRAYWEQGLEIPDQQDAPSKLLLSRHAQTSQLLPIKLQHLYLSVCSHRYPSILAFFPLDEAARAVFASLGCAESLTIATNSA